MDAKRHRELVLAYWSEDRIQTLLHRILQGIERKAQKGCTHTRIGELCCMEDIPPDIEYQLVDRLKLLGYHVNMPDGVVSW